ncbi:MAG: bifunctional (p)ppGpp synthetase/guanosine-3',5'-bis(diphosphate) 3'-pyrophosphohydrolase [Bacilli bacterium]|nr:bifunctional (p)ppGpp synthetase/guanosine-3',5'-bis(diphosphate) 3'-pyrophosphohydrolase [Bacilli bacterium]
MEEKKKLPPVNGGYSLHTFEQLKDVYEEYIHVEKDRQHIVEAFNFIVKKHEGQTRRSGEPYYHHLIEVAYIVAILHCGPATIIAALLHDVVEDTDTTVEDIKKMWGEDVAQIVDSLTKIQRLKLSKMNASEFEAEDHRKIFLGMAKDIRVILIKLADRLHNLRTLGALSLERQKAISKETLDVFIPIAHRLGLEKIKSEMQDLCLKYLEPEKYEEIKRLLSKKEKTMGKSLDSTKKRIADILFEKHIPFEIESRIKSIYSIYNKVYIKGHPFDEVYDILAFRIITETEIQCYEILGLIHQIYKPVPGRFKDYIAMPKPNMYQSLHTTILSGDGNIYEVQIRTKEMDEIAESGVAAHWAYKEGGYNYEKEQKEIENKLHWFRDFVAMSDESSEENASAAEYINNLTKDIFEANIYVFTPKGKVIELPNQATPVDFAYRIHTKIGDQCVGALVNGVMVPLNTVLKTGDIVEIRTSKTSPGPSERWLDFVVSSTAKSQIRKFISKRDAELLRDEKIAKGHQSLLDAFKDRGYTEAEMKEILDANKKALLENYNCETLDDLYVAISNHKPSTNAVLEFLKVKRKDNAPSFRKKEIKRSTCPVRCKGVGKIAIALSNCCNPIPGDDIIGYITKGKGVTVHRKNCPNVMREKERLVEVCWSDEIEISNYPVDIILECGDRPNLLTDIINSLSQQKVAVNSIHARLLNNGAKCVITATILVSDAKRLRDIFDILLGISSVYNVDRVIH